MKNGRLGVFHWPGWLWLGGKRSRDYLPARSTLNAQSTRHGARPGPKLAPGVLYTRPPYMPRSREGDERSVAREEMRGHVQKKVHFIHTSIVYKGGFAAAGRRPPWLRACP